MNASRDRSVRPRRLCHCAVNASRWLSYATAGAVTALAATNDAEAGILYSGVLNTSINAGPGSNRFYMHTLIANSVQGTKRIGRMTHQYKTFP